MKNLFLHPTATETAGTPVAEPPSDMEVAIAKSRSTGTQSSWQPQEVTFDIDTGDISIINADGQIVATFYGAGLTSNRWPNADSPLSLQHVMMAKGFKGIDYSTKVTDPDNPASKMDVTIGNLMFKAEIRNEAVVAALTKLYDIAPPKSKK